jgi:hypothetical protein
MLILESSKYLLSLGLAQSPYFSPLFGPLSELLPISLLTMSYLVAEVHGGQAVDQAILVLETLLSHVEGLLHCHRKCHAKCKDKAPKKQHNIGEVDMVRGPSWRTNKR